MSCQHENKPEPPKPLENVKHVIAVGAGKGGVGKSTVSALLAYGLKRKGLRTAVLDGDVYGPSLPKIMGCENEQPAADEDSRIIPPEAEGVPIVSMSYFVPPDQAVIWRGPMAQAYVKEFLERTRWGELDCLIVDLPPGTGDIPITLAQSVPLTGAVIVCTPQDLALADAVRALHMYERLGVPTLGVIENMSYYVCPECGHRDELFGHGGARAAARGLQAPFLGEIPLNISIRKNGDSGALAANFTDAPPEVVRALEEVVQQLHAGLEKCASPHENQPKLNIE